MSNDSKTLELQIRVAAQEAARTVTSLKGEVQTLAVEAGKFSKTEGAALGKSFKDAEAAAKDTVSGVGDLKNAVMRLAEVVALAKALSVIKDMGAFALQAADNFQTARNQFGVLLGDMEAGAGLFNEIKAFNDKTPFDLNTLTQTTNVLIAAKVPLQDLQAQLTKFGDLSQGNSQKLTSYVNAFSQAAAKGKADMQVLNTYLHQGVPILDALAKNFNVTTAEIVQMSSEGKISFADFSKALDDLTASGGQYFGGMELASKSLAAMQEGLKEAVNSLAASFGDMLLPAATDVVGIFTDITNAINESPIAKGVLAAAIVAVTGYMTAMAAKAAILAAKTWLAQAAQMGLNASLAVTNPLLLAGIAAAGVATAAYVAYAAKQQEAAREVENMALRQRRQADAINDTTDAIMRYTQALGGMTDEQIRNEISRINQDHDIPAGVFRILEPGQLERELGQLEALYETLSERRTEFIESMLAGLDAEKIKKINKELDRARKYLTDPNLNDGERPQLQDIIQKLTADLEELISKGEGINRLAAGWKEAWAGVWDKFRAEQAYDPFYEIELERKKKLEDAWDNYVREGNQKTLDQINEYYSAQRGKIIIQLAEEERRAQIELSRTKIDDIQYEFEQALRAVSRLEEQRVIAAANSEREIAAIRERFAQMREEMTVQFDIKIKKTELEEAREAIKNWQEELSDTLLLALMDTEKFSKQAAVAISDLAAQLADLSASAILSGFEEFGRALGEGEDAAVSMSRALAEMAQQILQQLPMMFLQAGLQLIANGQWPLGLGFIAAAGSSAIISGYVDGRIEEEKNKASKHAQGGVFDEYGQAARTFASGGAFTNQIVSAPTYFQHGGGFGLMGEAGPEAIMPLTRMPNGDLGVQTAGSGAMVTVNIYANPDVEVRKEESEDASGNKQIDVYFGEMVNRHIASGKADRALGGRYNLRAQGV